MKRSGLILFFSLFFITLFGQTKNEIEAKEFFWGAKDKHKDVVDIPEKWSNESAVILFKNENYSYRKSGKSVDYKASLRKRIKLLDQAAVEDFSEFSFKKRFRSSKGRYSFRSGKGNNVVGVKIIKPGGKEIEIDVNEESVEVDGESKLAISNLEVGDILDYYVYHIEPFKSALEFGFDPVETTLAEEYPIVDFKLTFETENDFFINFNSYNDAPPLKKKPSKKGNVRHYELTASDIEKNDYPRWFYPMVELPAYKFQVYFARSGKFEDRAMAFLPEKEDIIKKKVSKQEVLDLYDKRFKPDGEIGVLKSYVKGKSYKNDEEKVTAAYYYMRHYYLTRYIEAMYADDAGIMPVLTNYFSFSLFIRDQKQFIKYFTEFLKKEKIDYEIVIAQRRYDGPIEDLLIEKNVVVLLKIKTKKPLYAQFFGPHTNINEYSPLIEDTKVYLLTASKNKIDGIKTGQLPISTHEQNESRKEIDVTLADDFSGVEVKAVSKYKGHSKQDPQYERMLFNDYVFEDYTKYRTPHLDEYIKKKKVREKYDNELNALIQKMEKEQKERLKKSAEGEFEMKDIEDYDCQINETGRYDFDDYFTYTETFKAKDVLVKKAGPNYIVEVGKLIGGQIDLTDKERERTAKINMQYPRSFTYEIALNIPAGYTVSGLDKLQKNVDNTTGAFISSAKMEGNTLKISTSKQYKNNFEPNENWAMMIEFLDVAQQFTNEKILLKKSR